MSSDRRQQRRRERQRRRRGRPGGYESAGPVKFPGVFGWLQRRQRTFFAAGILVMLASLGAAFLGSQLGIHSGSSSSDTGDDAPAASSPADDTEDDVAVTTTPEPTETAEATPDDPDAIVRNYAAPPEMLIDPTHRFEAIIRTERGDVVIELLPEEAPGYVNNFVFLARNRFYEGLTFHRVIPGFVAQAGDPTATGFSGSGYSLEEELNDLPFEEGVLSMAKAGETVDGAQFFITLDPQPALGDAGFTVFGRVVEGLDILRSLTPRDPSAPGQPPGDRILSIEINEQAG